jgi:DNA-binding MarR family transcriptional regulator
MPDAAKHPPDRTDPLDNLLGYHLRRLSVMVMTDLTESLAPLELRPAEASILLVIASNPGATQSEVGRVLGIFRANMAPLVSALLERGLIQRKAVDGRSQALRLSSAGGAVYRRTLNVIRKHEQRLFGHLSRKTRGAMVAQMRSLWQAKR